MSDIFFVESSQVRSGRITIRGADARHIFKVMRRKSGDRITCKVFERTRYETEVEECGASMVVLRVLSEEKISVKNGGKTGLFLSLPRVAVLNSLLPKCVEIGLDFLQPVITERSFIKTKSKFNLKRYQRMVVESMKQCGRDDRLEILPVITLSELVSSAENFHKKYSSYRLIFPWEGADGTSAEIKAAAGEKSVFFIGPEGGFTLAEADQVKDLGFTAVRLTDNILRVETAVLYTLIRLRDN